LEAGQTGELGARWIRPVIPTDIPRPVADTIEMALAEDPRRRHRNVEQLITVLEDLAGAWPASDQAPSRRDDQAAVAGAVPSTLRSPHLGGPRSPAPATESPAPQPSEVAPGVASSRGAPSNEDSAPLPQVPSLDVPSRPVAAPRELVL